MNDSVEIRFGTVVHVRPCDCEAGKVLACHHHGGGCDCSGRYVECDECQGTGELVDADCVCPRCMTLFTRVEEARYGQQH